MKSNRHASQMVEYLLMFAVVVTVILGISGIIGNKAGTILKNSLDELDTTTYSYAWVPRNCSACLDGGGGAAVCADDGGTYTCSYVCERNDGTTVADTNCDGAAPASIPIACNTQPCPIDCEWSATWDIGTCFPACGNNRSRTDTRVIEIQAAYGGAECDPEDGTRFLTGEPYCPDVPCVAVCGDGYVSPGELCDGANLDGKGCSDAQAYTPFSLTGAGTLGCASDCTFDVGQCYTEVFDGWVSEMCGGGGCAADRLYETEHRYTQTVSGTFVSEDPIDGDQCVVSGSCADSCGAPVDGHATVCSYGSASGWTYLVADFCPSYPGPCTAICDPDIPHTGGGYITSNTSGCGCSADACGESYAISDTSCTTSSNMPACYGPPGPIPPPTCVETWQLGNECSGGLITSSTALSPEQCLSICSAAGATCAHIQIPFVCRCTNGSVVTSVNTFDSATSVCP